MTQLLTHSRQDCFKTCRKRHFFLYEQGIRRDVDAKALRMGSAFHDGLEDLGNARGIDAACETVGERYAQCPEAIEADEWALERETVTRLVCGYAWRWQDYPLTHLASELSFELPLLNPETNKPTPIFSLAGKMDGIVQLGDGRLAVKETKLFGDDIGPDSSLWRRMRIDHQVSLYVLAARRLGYAVDTVIYDVARKPTIAPTAVPVLDELGAKIVLNGSGIRIQTAQGSWRQTGDKEKGYVLQQRAMTADEWGEKLNADIAERPDFYFSRVEVARMDQDLREYEFELWEIQQTIREAQRTKRWYRTVNRNTCDFCPVFDLCTNSGFDPNGSLPEGFIRVADVHPELHLNRSENHVNGNPGTAAEESAAATAESCAAT